MDPEKINFSQSKIVLFFTNKGERAYQEEEKLALFNPFARPAQKNPGRYIYGTGLGLNLCYSIVKNWNGEIDIESIPQTDSKEEELYNTIVTVTLPKEKKND